MREIDGLIERLRKATGPDRELDRLIALETDRIDSRYTASIDAALTLVPEAHGGAGLWWELNSTGGSHGSGKSFYIARTAVYRDGAEAMERFTGIGSTPAIALCIAALEARQVQGTKEQFLNAS